jgi:SulP family sulfate permease
MKTFVPKLVTVFKEGYSKNLFVSDLTAGIVVGIVALPLAIAFAIASGVKPEQGLFTAVIAGFVVAMLGGSRTQVSGPTGAFIVVVYGIVQQYGYSGLAVATMIAGVLLIAMGLARMGTLLKFIPFPLTVGFTSGIAVIIFTSQVKDFFGLALEKTPAGFLEQWQVYAGALQSVNMWALAVAGVSVVTITVWPKVSHRVPGSLVAILLGTATVQLFELPVETIGSRFGAVPSVLPSPSIPQMDWTMVRQMFGPAVTIALLGGIESLLSAVVADGMTGNRHRSNMELIAQGAGNVLSPLFGGIPATGAIARTATNIRNGAKTPVAAMIHAVVLLLLMVLFARWAVMIPMPVLSAVLVVVAYNMSEWRTFIKLLKSPKSDIMVLITTFALTVLIDLTVAIQAGVVLSALLFMKRMSDATQVNILTKAFAAGEQEEEPDAYSLSTRAVPSDVLVFEVQGSLFFGAVEQFKDTFGSIDKEPRVFILRMRNVLAIDASGINALEDVMTRYRKKGVHFILSGVHAQPLFALRGAGVLDRIPEENICANIDAALARANELRKISVT